MENGKLSSDNLTKAFKQSNKKVYNNISLETNHIEIKLEITDRVNLCQETNLRNVEAVVQRCSVKMVFL